MRSVSMAPEEAPSVMAMKRIGHVFDEFHSNSSAMIVLEGDQPLGPDAHHFYDEMVAKLRADPTKNLVIATGAQPFVPPLPGLDEVGCLTSDTLWQLRELPRRLLVLGVDFVLVDAVETALTKQTGLVPLVPLWR